MSEEKRKELASWLRQMICVVLGTVLVFTLVVRLIRVDGPSMRETLQDRDVLLAVNPLLSGGVDAGDIVIVREKYFNHGQPIVKRVIATEGQTVDIDFEAGMVFVDGELLEEDYIREPTWTEEGQPFPITVPEGCVFVMGDNRNDSLDSRSPDLGSVPTKSVIGKAVLLLFPGETAELERREWSRMGSLT